MTMQGIIATTTPASRMPQFSVVPAEVSSARPAGSGAEDVLRQERRDQKTRDVDELADLEVDGDAADGVRLLAIPAPLTEVIDHVEQGVARGDSGVLRV